MSEKNWWKEAIVYQIYPRSFQDNNGDGIGDLQGIISRLDYIASLGIDVIWLNPIFSSPNDDMGYDISDYRDIMKEFGTMADFDALLKGMHDRNIKMVLDLVVNHSSDEHEWFRQSRSSRDNPYRNYYHWWPAEKGKPSHRWSFFDINEDAWKYDPATDAYYLHYFSQKQPDLNWENPKVREEIYSMMRFWFDKGIDGFRMDVIPYISKDTSFPPIPESYKGDFIKYYAHGPRLHQYLQEMNREVLSSYNIMTVAEALGIGSEEALDMVDADRRELNMLYHFEAMDIKHLSAGNAAPDPKYDLLEFKNVYTKWDSVFAQKGWGTVYLGNHDQPRMVSRWGNEEPEYRDLSSKMLTSFLLTMRGTPYYYAGDELGMTNIRFDNIESYRDIRTINWYKKIQAEGGDVHALLESEKLYARDNGRTPFQWDNTDHAGFTTGVPWLKVHPNYATVNAAAEERDPQSPLNFFRKLVQIRKQNKTLIYGKYTLLDKSNTRVYAYTREDDTKRFLVLLNFAKQPASFQLGFSLSDYKIITNNYPDNLFSEVSLKPYQAVILEQT